MRYVTTAEFPIFYASIQGDGWLDWRDRLLLTLLFYSGLRAGEVCDLGVNDIDRDQKVLHVREGKGGKDREVPYAPQLEELIDKYLALRPRHPNHEPLFVSAMGRFGIRGPLGVSGLQTVIRHRLKQCCMNPPGLHAFRHGFAMWSLNNGMSMSAVSEALGHNSVTTTEAIYAHWLVGGLRSEYDKAFQRVMSDEAVRT